MLQLICDKCNGSKSLPAYYAVLADLPLPVALPTPTEESILGAAKKLSADTKRLLDSTSSAICSKVTETLLAVDMGFL